MLKHSDLSEYFLNRLMFKYEHWMLEHGKDNKEIENFIEWCKKEEQEYLNAPRAPDGKSFLEREAQGKDK